MGRSLIASFLGWPESRVSYSLERLKMITDDTIDKEVIDSFPTERAASQRATARMLGVSAMTINNDVNKFTPETKNTIDNKVVTSDTVNKFTPVEIPAWIGESGLYQQC